MAVYPVHRRTRMGGRDPHEPHRAATPLELLFDLTFVVAFGIAANELVAVGAGLHAAAYHVEEHSELGVPGTLLTVAVPLAIYVLAFYALYARLVRAYDPFHPLLRAVSVGVLAASVVLAVAGAPGVWCLVVLALTPWVTVVGYETVGHRHGDQVMADG